jgi:hypothetical protein
MILATEEILATWLTVFRGIRGPSAQIVQVDFVDCEKGRRHGLLLYDQR